MTRTCAMARHRALLMLAVLAGFGVVLARLVYLQVIKHEHYEALAEKQHYQRLAWVEARGSIYDRQGRVLAQSHHARSLVADPAVVKPERARAFARAAAGPLGLGEEDLYARLTREGKRFVVLKRRLSTAEEKEILPQVYATPGLDFRQEWMRSYPTGPMLSPLLGVLGGEQYGLSGLERWFDKLLKGEAGEKVVLRDAKRQQVSLEPVVEKPARRGHELVLTIDRGMQTVLYCELEKGFAQYKPKSASALVMDPWTGEILAMATLPAQDPAAAIDPGMGGLVPRMVVDIYEPGSTVKPFVYAALLENRLGRPEEKLNCGMGRMAFAGRELHDVHPYGLLTLEDIIAKSSNIGAAQMGQRLGSERLWRTYDALGFGRRTWLPLPGESAGVFRPLPRWSALSNASVSVGHEISVTMVQMAVAYSALANGGQVVQPFLVKRILSPEGNVLRERTPCALRRVFSPATCRQVTTALEKVVEDGTAKKAYSAEYRVAGKTGTTEKLVNGRYDKGHNIASFMGFAPASRPRLVVGVMYDEPRGASFGGVVAAPVASRTLEECLRYLGVPPDQPPPKEVARR